MNKNYFDQFKEEIVEEHKAFDTHQEQREITKEHCEHMGKVKAVPGGVRCECGAMWTGKNVDMLLSHFMEVV